MDKRMVAITGIEAFLSLGLRNQDTEPNPYLQAQLASTIIR